MADVELYLGRFLILLVGILCLSSTSVQQERKVRYWDDFEIGVALLKVFCCITLQFCDRGKCFIEF